MKIIYLEQNSTFRTQLHSDTLWGIICWAIRNVYGNEKLENILQTYNEGNPQFIISSAFPYFEVNNKKKLFFPKPLIIDFDNDNTDYKNKQEKLEAAKKRKKIKEIQFLELQDFNELINKNASIKELLNKIVNDKSYIIPEIKSESVPHNTIDRISGGTLKLEGQSGQLFNIDEFYVDIQTVDNDLNKYATGLFFLAKGKTEELEGALRYLSHVGFGGDRSIGKGKFKVLIDDFNDLKEPADYNATINLSLFYPKIDELEVFKNSPLFSYQLEERQGYVSFLNYKKFHKPKTIMFKEGSVFPKLEKEFIGQNRILHQKDEIIPHNVYQYGYGFMIKLKI